MKTLLTTDKIAQYYDECITIFDFNSGVKTIETFISKVEELSQQYGKDKNRINSFKGNILEVLAEIFFSIFNADTSVGIKDYTPVPISDDFGVDGIGINVNGDKCAIQIKYKANPLDIVLYEDMAKTYTAGREIHKLSLDNDDTIFLFTTGYSISISCSKVFKRKIRIINRNIIAGKIDNNLSFWEMAEELIMNTLDYLNK
jgi:hypothetical protein